MECCLWVLLGSFNLVVRGCKVKFNLAYGVGGSVDCRFGV